MNLLGANDTRCINYRLVTAPSEGCVVVVVQCGV